MIMRPAIFFLLLLLTSVSGLQSIEGPETARLRVSISTTFGVPLEKADVVLTSVGPKQTVTASSDARGEARFERVPYGLYDVEVKLLGFSPRQERIRVYQEQLSFRLGLALASTHSTVRPEISGSVSPMGGRESERWARLVSLFGGELVENALDSNGRYRLTGMTTGLHILLILEKNKVLATEPVEILEGANTVNIRLDQRRN